NATGESHISPMALGGMQLRRDKTTGSPKLKETKYLETGVVTLSPVYVHPQALITAVRGVMDNFAFGLMAFSAAVQKSHPNEYKAQVDAAGLAGAKTRAHDEKSLGQYLAQLEAAKGILAAPPIETADDIASKEDAKEPVPA
ncbi:MAG: hypothetical protein Q7R34_15300, partial [Dehalococcoidia bacterium]|nr:hypothetical protein [Dehalococcoidia bacterium]